MSVTSRPALVSMPPTTQPIAPAPTMPIFIADSRGEPEAGAHLELFLVEERAAVDPAHGAAVAAVDEGGLTHDERAVALVTAVGVVGAPGRRPRRRERYDAGAGAPRRRLGLSWPPRGLHEPGGKDTTSWRIMKAVGASTEALFVRQDWYGPRGPRGERWRVVRAMT